MPRLVRSYLFWILLAFAIISALPKMHKLMDKLKGGREAKGDGSPVVPPRPWIGAGASGKARSGQGKRVVGYFVSLLLEPGSERVAFREATKQANGAGSLRTSLRFADNVINILLFHPLHPFLALQRCHPLPLGAFVL